MSSRVFVALLLAGLALRSVPLSWPGMEDVGVWKIWAYNASRDVTGMYGVGGSPPVRAVLHYGRGYTTVDYPPVALYEMALVGIFYRGLHPGFPDDARLMVALKLPGLIAGALLTLVLFSAVRLATGRSGLARGAAAAWWVNPAAILNGEVLAYLDPLLLLPAVAALWLAHERRPAWAGTMLALAACTKPQGVLMAPALLLAVTHLDGRRGLLRAIAGGAGTTVAIFLPFVLAGALPNAFYAYWSFIRRDLLSAQAANVWWIANWLERARHLIEPLGAAGAYTARVKGVMALSTWIESGWPNPRPFATAAVVAAIAWAMWRLRGARDLGAHAALAAFTVLAYFTLAVAVHENHIMLALPLLVLAAAIRPIFIGPAILATIVSALSMNMYYGLGRGIGWAIPRTITIVDLSVVNAAAGVALFVWMIRLVGRASRADALHWSHVDRLAQAEAADGRRSPARP